MLACGAVGALEASAGKGGPSGGGEAAPEELDAEAEAALAPDSTGAEGERPGLPTRVLTVSDGSATPGGTLELPTEAGLGSASSSVTTVDVPAAAALA